MSRITAINWRGSAKQFSTMFRSGAAAVRLADPGVAVVLGGMADWSSSRFFKALSARDGFVRSFDVLNLHGYLETWDDTPAEEYPDRIAGYANALQKHRGRNRPDIWLAEFGYSSLRNTADRPTAGGSAAFEHEHTPIQAVALLRHHVLALAVQQLSLTAWFRIRDLDPSESVIGDNQNRHFGIIDAAGNPKPAFEALRLWNRLFDQPVRRLDLPQELPKQSAAALHLFERKDGTIIAAGWLPRNSAGGDSRLAETACRDERREIVMLRLPFAAGRVKIFDNAGTAEPRLRGVEDGVLTNVELSAEDIFLAEVQPISTE